VSRQTCCNQNCGQGDECPLRQPRDLTEGERRLLWFAGVAWVVLFALALAGCEREEVVMSRRVSSATTHYYADPETGCQYYAEISGAGDFVPRTPRIAADGKTHMGCQGGGK
jgi:hypothetical protein